MNRKHSLLAFVIANLTCVASAHADFATLVDNLTNPLERSSGRAVLQTYEDLKLNAGCYDSMREPVANLETTANGGATAAFACTGAKYELFKNVRAIVHTGNQLTNSGPTDFSLGSCDCELGVALRWIAAEEYSALGAMTTHYQRSQSSLLSSRFSALRTGARGFDVQAANGTAYYGGGGASGNAEEYSRWGGFIHYADGRGNKAPTALEDAFDFNDQYLNLGVDYRVDDHWLVGLMANSIEQKLDFDGSKSIVSGNIKASGYTVSPFAMYQYNQFYVSGAYTHQSLDFDSVRAIAYVSQNPNVASPNTQNLAKTASSANSYFLSAGYNFAYNQFSAEPFVNLTQTDTSIDAFTERDVKNTAFDLAVNAQELSQTHSSLGLTLRYTFTPSFAVITPYTTYEYISQHEDKTAVVKSHFVNAAAVGDVFSIAADPLDKTYAVATVGFVSVVRGARQSTADGVLSGGIQLFGQYKKFVGLEHYSAHISEVGLRYEF